MGILDGVRVLEVSEWAMGPSAAAILNDWGADVIKVEHATRGDPIRGLRAWGIEPDAGQGGLFHLWEAFNRGKRSIGIDLSLEEGRDLLLSLAETSDVFITNFLPDARTKLGIDVSDLRQANPRIIYGRGSANGPRGGEAGEGGFDGVTYWMRSGAGAAAVPAGVDQVVSLPGPAFGDSQTGLAFAGGLAAALYHRERTGNGSIVDISLLGSGVWAMQGSLLTASAVGMRNLPLYDRTSTQNPLTNYYRTQDGRSIRLGMLQSDRHWESFCRVIGREELVEDPRFRDSEARAENCRACIQILDEVFASRSLEAWKAALSGAGGQWAVVQLVGELLDDPQVWENDYLQQVDYGPRGTLTLAPSPVQFDESAPTLSPAPEFGAHTEEVLLELGMSWEQILELKSIGAIC